MLVQKKMYWIKVETKTTISNIKGRENTFTDNFGMVDKKKYSKQSQCKGYK